MYYHQQYREENNLPKAFGISALIMGVLLLIGFFIVFGNTIPQYGMGGIIVNYGTSEEGMGDDYMSVEEPSVHENANNVRPDRIDPENTPTVTPSQQVADKVVATQDVEDAPAVAKPERPVTANSPQTTVAKPEAKPTVNPNALFKGKKNDGRGAGDGTGSTPGNQGSRSGDPVSSNYGEGGSGFGNEPISLTSRHWATPPIIVDKRQFEGRVNVLVRIDRNGNVTYVRSGVKGSTYLNTELNQEIERAVRSAKMNVLKNAPEAREFIMPLDFKLQ